MGLRVLYEYLVPGLRAAFRNPAWPGGRGQIGLQVSECLRHWTSGNRYTLKRSGHREDISRLLPYFFLPELNIDEKIFNNNRFNIIFTLAGVL